jgi:hypothetical protein
MHPFLAQFRRTFVLLAESLGKFFANKTQRGNITSPRMCPFCGLITPRSKPLCLECGKSLRGAQHGF